MNNPNDLFKVKYGEFIVGDLCNEWSASSKHEILITGKSLCTICVFTGRVS